MSSIKRITVYKDGDLPKVWEANNEEKLTIWPTSDGGLDIRVSYERLYTEEEIEHNKKHPMTTLFGDLSLSKKTTVVRKMIVLHKAQWGRYEVEYND